MIISKFIAKNDTLQRITKKSNRKYNMKTYRNDDYKNVTVRKIIT